MATKVTKAQATSALRALRRQHKAFIEVTGSEPAYVPDFDWTGSGPSPAIVWEEGPYGWAFLFPFGGIDEEYGFRVPAVELPGTVWVEPITSWAVGLWPQ